ncbi:hypothetical protein E4U15_001732 [Claviceps sp. LM218 group G6]|nr:hypothetical protein E4U15_001732 [Claviceps sp. LM218 group G6]
MVRSALRLCRTDGTTRRMDFRTTLVPIPEVSFGSPSRALSAAGDLRIVKPGFGAKRVEYTAKMAPRPPDIRSSKHPASFRNPQPGMPSVSSSLDPSHCVCSLLCTTLASRFAVRLSLRFDILTTAPYQLVRAQESPRHLLAIVRPWLIF